MRGKSADMGDEGRKARSDEGVAPYAKTASFSIHIKAVPRPKGFPPGGVRVPRWQRAKNKNVGEGLAPPVVPEAVIGRGKPLPYAFYPGLKQTTGTYAGEPQADNGDGPFAPIR